MLLVPERLQWWGLDVVLIIKPDAYPFHNFRVTNFVDKSGDGQNYNAGLVV